MQKQVYVSKESAYLRLVKYGSRSSLKAWVKAWRIAVASSNHRSDLDKIQQGRGESDSLLVCFLADSGSSLLPVVLMRVQEDIVDFLLVELSD